MAPETTTSSEDRERAELFALYRIALDEYRFQVNLNWSRTQYYIALNLGIFGVATSLLKLNDPKLASLVGIGLYLAGGLCCVLSLIAGHVQREYFRQTKRHKAAIEARLELGDLAIRTTPGMAGDTARRLAKVTTFNTVILSIVLLLDAAGLGYSIGHF